MAISNNRPSRRLVLVTVTSIVPVVDAVSAPSVVVAVTRYRKPLSKVVISELPTSIGRSASSVSATRCVRSKPEVSGLLPPLLDGTLRFHWKPFQFGLKKRDPRLFRERRRLWIEKDVDGGR